MAIVKGTALERRQRAQIDAMRSSRMSITTPNMTWELEAACHVMTKGVLTAHLDRKYGVGQWEIRDDGRANEGVTVLSRSALAADAVECGLAELRRQLAEYDRTTAAPLRAVS